jgi:acyl-coenzyme A synthetase/AMP-(fatty) acid ligase
MLVEVRSEGAGFGELAREAALAVASASGATLDECVFLPKGALPKTPSGKIQRYRARRLVHDESAALARVAVTRG